MDPTRIMFGSLEVQNALPFMKYDVCKDSHGTYFDDGSVALSEYLVKDRLSFVPTGRKGSLQSNVMPTLLDLPGETYFHMRQRVATEDGRMFSQSLLQNLWDLEQIGECLEPFGPSNVRVRGGKCILYNVKRINLDAQKLEGNYMCACSPCEVAFGSSYFTI